MTPRFVLPQRMDYFEGKFALSLVNILTQGVKVLAMRESKKRKRPFLRRKTQAGRC